MPTALRSFVLLDVVSTTPPVPKFARLVSTPSPPPRYGPGEKCRPRPPVQSKFLPAHPARRRPRPHGRTREVEDAVEDEEEHARLRRLLPSPVSERQVARNDDVPRHPSAARRDAVRLRKERTFVGGPGRDIPVPARDRGVPTTRTARRPHLPKGERAPPGHTPSAAAGNGAGRRSWRTTRVSIAPHRITHSPPRGSFSAASTLSVPRRMDELKHTPPRLHPTSLPLVVPLVSARVPQGARPVREWGALACAAVARRRRGEAAIRRASYPSLAGFR